MIEKIIGIIGVFLLASAWIPQTLHTIKTKQKVNVSFNILYILGSFALFIYSTILFDQIFMFLNLLAAMVAGINLYYTYRIK